MSAVARRRLAALVSPYSLDWRPLPAPGADAAALRAAGRALGRRLRLRPPVRLDTLDPEAPGLVPLLDGLAAPLASAVIETVVAHEIGHCWRHVQGDWSAAPAPAADRVAQR